MEKGPQQRACFFPLPAEDSRCCRKLEWWFRSRKNLDATCFYSNAALPPYMENDQS
jgi:hypothetical protein